MPSRILGLISALFVVTAPTASAQVTYTFKDSPPSTSWTNGTNWSPTSGGEPASNTNYPGVPLSGNNPGGTTSDLAAFANISGSIGIDMNTTVGGLSVGRIEYNSATSGGTLQIGNSSSSTNGFLRLNGSGNTTLVSLTGNRDLIITNTPSGSGSQTMELRLGITNGVFNVASGRQLTVGNNITQATAGSGFTVQGGGTMILTGTNTYTGTTTISAGTLQVGSGGTAGTLGGGAVTNNATLTFNRSDAVTVSNAISGTGGLTKLGGSTLTLTGGNSYGTTTISAGTLEVGNGGTTGTLGGGAVTNNATLTFNRSDNVTVANNISGSGSVTQLGAGVTTLSGTNSYGGGTTLSGGTLALQSAGAIGTSGTISFGGGTLRYSSANTTDYSSRFSTAAGQAYSIDTNGQSVTLGSALSSGSGTLTKLGGGTLALTGGNSYGTTTISAGTLQVGSGGTTGTLGGGAVTNNATLTFNRSGSLTVAGAISGTGVVNQSGGGTVTFTGANTYSGATNVNSGTLWVNGTSTGTGAVTVNSGATLGGTGSLNGAVTVAGGGILNAGNSVGTLTVNNNLSVSNGGTFRAELGAGTSSDQLNLSGGANTLNLANGSTVNLVASGFTRTGTPATFTLADLNGTGASLLQLNGVNAAPGTVISTFTANGLGGGSFSTITGSVNLTATGFGSLLNGDTLTLQRSTGGDLVVTFTPVPEPGSVLALCGLALAGGAAWRKWRKKLPAEVTPAA